MQSRAPLPSNFAKLIDELFDETRGSVEAAKPNRFSIDSLEAAWALSNTGRERPDRHDFRPRNPYVVIGESDNEADALLDPNKILLELGLDANFSETDIATLRREFALRNHPDRVQPDLRELATQRMMIANDLMDRYVERLRGRPRSGR